MKPKNKTSLAAHAAALEQQLVASRIERDKLEAQVKKLEAEKDRPYTLLKYVGSPFGDWEVTSYEPDYSQMNMTSLTRESFVWQVAVIDFSDTKRKVVTLKFLKREEPQQAMKDFRW